MDELEKGMLKEKYNDSLKDFLNDYLKSIGITNKTAREDIINLEMKQIGTNNLSKYLEEYFYDISDTTNLLKSKSIFHVCNYSYEYGYNTYDYEDYPLIESICEVIDKKMSIETSDIWDIDVNKLAKGINMEYTIEQIWEFIRKVNDKEKIVKEKELCKVIGIRDSMSLAVECPRENRHIIYNWRMDELVENYFAEETPIEFLNKENLNLGVVIENEFISELERYDKFINDFDGISEVDGNRIEVINKSKLEVQNTFHNLIELLGKWLPQNR